MQTAIMLIGLPGSGKSTFAEKLAKNEDTIIVSTDKIREETYGDEAIQGDGNEVFEKAYALINNYLRNGYSVIFDATNTKRKYRKAFVERFKRWQELGVKFYAILIATPYEKCLENNLNRRRVVPEEVIKRMMCNFEVPMKSEGWDVVEVYRPFAGWAPNGYNYYLDYLYNRNAIPHDCEPWHTGTITDHMCAVMCAVNKDKILPKEEEEFYKVIAIWHDVGKFYVKVYNEKKKRCVYYNHNNVSAYCYCSSQNASLDIAFVIEKHMEAHKYNSDQECYDALFKQGIDSGLICAIIRFGRYDNEGALAVEGTVLR